MDKSAEVVAISGEHIVLEGDTIELQNLDDLELVSEELSLVDDAPSDPYNTSTVKILTRRDFR